MAFVTAWQKLLVPGYVVVVVGQFLCSGPGRDFPCTGISVWRLLLSQRKLSQWNGELCHTSGLSQHLALQMLCTIAPVFFYHRSWEVTSKTSGGTTFPHPSLSHENSWNVQQFLKQPLCGKQDKFPIWLLHIRLFLFWPEAVLEQVANKDRHNHEAEWGTGCDEKAANGLLFSCYYSAFTIKDGGGRLVGQSASHNKNSLLGLGYFASWSVWVRDLLFFCLTGLASQRLKGF